MKYQSTGEIREVKRGEYYLSGSLTCNAYRSVALASSIYGVEALRVIMEPINETPDDFDTQVQADELRCEGCGASTLAECMCDRDWSERADELAGFEIPSSR